MQTKQKFPTEQEVRQAAIDKYVSGINSTKESKIFFRVILIPPVLWVVAFIMLTFILDKSTRLDAFTFTSGVAIVIYMVLSFFLCLFYISSTSGKRKRKVTDSLSIEQINTIVDKYVDEQVKIQNANVEYYREEFDEAKRKLDAYEEEKKYYEDMKASMELKTSVNN